MSIFLELVAEARREDRIRELRAMTPAERRVHVCQAHDVHRKPCRRKPYRRSARLCAVHQYEIERRTRR